MKKKSILPNTILNVIVFWVGVTLAQEPVQNIDKNKQPNLAEAQFLGAQANTDITAAQEDNRYDMHGHAQKATDLLLQVSQELKVSTEDAEAAKASSAVTRGDSATDQSLQNIISGSCNGNQPGVVSLTGNASYSVSSTVTIPSNCTVRGNGARIIATSTLIGDLISVTSVSDVHIIGSLTLNSANANVSTGKQSHTIEFFDVKNSSVNDISFTGSTHGELNLWGVSKFDGRNLTFENASAVPRATSPAMVIFNWVRGTPTQASTDVNIDSARCIGSPTTTPGCIYADGNYNRTGTPGQSNQRINVSNVTIRASTDDGVEYDHTSGSISGIRCGPGTIKNQCVLLRQTSQVKVDGVTCLAGTAFCVEVARFGNDDATDSINVSHVTGTGISGSKESAVVHVRNSSTSADVTNVTVDGVVADGSSNVGVFCEGPGSTGKFLQHVSFKNITVHHSKNDGLLVAWCQDVAVINVETFNNGQGASCATYPYAALRITQSNNVLVSGIRAYDDQARKTQCYGLTVNGGSTRVSVNGAELRDDLNASGGVHNESADTYIVYKKTATTTVTIGGPRNR
jgi:hypothetical protein